MKREKRYRPLTEAERSDLAGRGCTSSNWNDITTAHAVDALSYRNVEFCGSVRLGRTERAGRYGIYNARIADCHIGDNTLIENISGSVSGYDIGDRVVISGCGDIVVRAASTFGNGTEAKVINEAGGREVLLWDRLTAQTAYIMALYRHESSALATLRRIVDEYCDEVRSDRGTIADDTTIKGCRTMINVRCGPSARIENALRVEEGTINSTAEAPSLIGDGVIIENFIMSDDSTVKEGAVVKRCFIGQGSVIGSRFTALDSLFFANSAAFNGEAVSLFAGPFTNTHHKSTLLIAMYCSFFNAGSGSNQSNHNYRLGPIHQGIVERGTKSASGSYALWPSRFGPHSMLIGRLYINTDTSGMPFSYIIGSDAGNKIIPGITLQSSGTIRDAIKWRERDRRRSHVKHDIVNCELFTPYSAGKIAEAITLLESLKESAGESSRRLSFNGMKIPPGALEKGLRLYRMALVKYCGNLITERIVRSMPATLQELREALEPVTEAGTGKWIDMAGMVLPVSEAEALIKELGRGSPGSAEELSERLFNIEGRYQDMEWSFVSRLTGELAGSPPHLLTPEEIAEFINRWQEAVVSLDYLLYEDAMKEFTERAGTGFGIDGSEQERKSDFVAVRGSFEDHPSVKIILNHIRSKKELAERVTEIVTALDKV